MCTSPPFSYSCTDKLHTSVLNTRTLTCKQWIIAESISAVALEIMVEIHLILRFKSRFMFLLSFRRVKNLPCNVFPVYALYTANKRLLWFIIPLFVVQIIIMVVTLSITLPGVIAATRCAEVIFPIGIIAYWLVQPTSLYQLII